MRERQVAAAAAAAATATATAVSARILLIPLLLVLRIPEFADAQRSLEFYDLLPEDPKLYDKMRPPKKDGQATTVHFHVTVMGLDSIDETSMTYAADIFFAQTWKDNRLRLPENMTSEYRLLEVDWLKRMWRPDSFFKNAKSVTFQTMTIPNHYLWLYKDKTILYMVKLTLKLSCAMNFLIYPHDTQECKLQMESLSHTTEEMIFQWDPDVPLVVDESIELPQLQLIKNYTADCTQVYSTGNFTCLEVIFVLKRRLGYYLFHTYVPTCLIVIMSWVSFWIKPEAAPARVTLGVTSLLTLSTQHAKSQASLPPVSYLKAVDAFMSVCTIFVFMALMEYCLVNIVLIMGESEPPKPAAPPAAPPAPGGGGAGGGGAPNGPATEGKLDKIFDIASKVVAPAARSTSPSRPELASPPRPTYVLPPPPRGIIYYSAAGAGGVAGPIQPASVMPRGAQDRRGTSGRSSRGLAPCCMQDSAMLLANRGSCSLQPAPSQKPAPPAGQQQQQQPQQPAPAAPAANNPPAASAGPAKPNKMQRAKIRAVNIDRTSRVLFPALFAFLNVSYWVIFWKYV